MTDYTELKRLAEAAPEGPWFGPEYAPGTSYVFDVDLGTLLEYQSIDSEKDACLRYVAAANPAAVLALVAENERLTKQWGDRPAYRTPEYESKRDAMWRRAHMVATSKGYDHINMAIAAAPNACPDCMGCGGEWQGDGAPNAVCETCKGGRGKTLEAERDQLRAEVAGLKTGYEAYERVNAELKAENERLATENTDIESAAITYIEDMQEAQHENERLKAEVDSLTREADRQYTTIEAYRKDAERFQWLLKNASVILDKKTAYQAETGFIKYDTMPGRTETELAIDAAMGKGERS